MNEDLKTMLKGLIREVLSEMALGVVPERGTRPSRVSRKREVGLSATAGTIEGETPDERRKRVAREYQRKYRRRVKARLRRRAKRAEKQD